MIDIQDIHNIYVAGVSRSGAVSLDTPINLESIQLDETNLKESAVRKLRTAVSEIVEGSRESRPISKPDPLAALFMNASPEDLIDDASYVKFEQLRLADKWRGNRIGQINELIIDLFNNVELSSSGKLDVIVYKDAGKSAPIAIAEIKNRYNTMNSSSAIRTRQMMESLVLDRGSQYFGCDAVLVERIPRTDGREVLFNPSDPRRGQVGVNAEKIKRMGLQQFLERYCNDETAYVKSLVLIARFMEEAGAIPNNYDLRFIFSLLKDSLT